jgi:hypothetical protein
VTETKCKNASAETPWSIAFKLALLGIGCLAFGLYINGQATDPISTGVAKTLIDIGTLTILILIGSALFVLGIWYLYNKSRCPDQGY